MKKKFKILFIGLLSLMILVTIPLVHFENRVLYKEKLDAISKVKSIMGYSGYPDKPCKVKGTIYGGGPAPGIQISGELETNVKLSFNGSYKVTFIEYWNSKNFKYVGSKDGIQSHFTTFEVRKNKVKFTNEGGDFPPEQVK